jgi:uncharacterized protein (TIGR03905 family)
MQYVYENKGVCSMQTIVDIGDDHVIENVNVIGGCNGNLKGIAALLVGVKAEDAIKRLEGITCGYKKTSCPDQIAQALKEALNQ